MGKRKAAAGGYFLLGVIAIFLIIGQFIVDNFLIIGLVTLAIAGVIILILGVKSKNKQSQINTTNTNNKESNDIFRHFPTEAMAHLKRAQDSESQNDYLGARVSYLSCVDLLKRDKTAKRQLEYAKNEYAQFVRRDPIFNKMLPFFLDGVRQNPGILQSDITKQAEDMEWPDLRSYNRPIAKDDIRYVFYFAEDFGLLVRQKDGRSYRLYLPEQLKNVTEGQQ